MNARVWVRPEVSDRSDGTAPIPGAEIIQTVIGLGRREVDHVHVRGRVHAVVWRQLSARRKRTSSVSDQRSRSECGAVKECRRLTCPTLHLSERTAGVARGPLLLPPPNTVETPLFFSESEARELSLSV